MKNRKLWASVLAGFLAAVMLLTLILGVIPTPASAASSSEIKKQINDLKNQKNQLQEQMKELQSQYEQNEDEIADMVSKKLVIDQEIFLLYEQIDLMNQELSAYALLIADKQDELDAANDRHAELSRKNMERIRTMEEDGNVSYWSVIFKASSFADLLDRLNMIDEIAASDRRRLKELSDAADQVSQARDALAAEKEELDAAKEELDAAYAVLEEKQAEAERLLNELIAKGFEMKDLYNQYEEEEKNLLADIALKEEEYQEAKELEWIAYMATYTTPPTTQPATQPPETGSDGDSGNTGEAAKPETENNSGNSGSSGSSSGSAKWLVPCSYRMLTSPFGNRESPTAGASTDHKGVDLAGPEGTPIYASRSGTVTIAQFSRSAGYYVTINHGDGFSSVYMHMTHYTVSKGQKVDAGQIIGYMGSTGISTGSHLHFGIIYKGSYVNPANYVSLHA